MRAIATGSKSARITPLLGLAFFTSAISRMGGPAGQCGEEIAHRAGAGDKFVQRRLRRFGLCPGNFLAFRGDDLSRMVDMVCFTRHIRQKDPAFQCVESPCGGQAACGWHH